MLEEFNLQEETNMQEETDVAEESDAQEETDAQEGSNLQEDANSQEKIKLECDIEEVINYAAVMNGYKLIREIAVQNLTENDFEQLRLRIHADNDLIEDYELPVDRLYA